MSRDEGEVLGIGCGGVSGDGNGKGVWMVCQSMGCKSGVGGWGAKRWMGTLWEGMSGDDIWDRCPENNPCCQTLFCQLSLKSKH